MTSGVFWNLQDFHDINKGSFKDEFNRFVENQTDLLFYREGLTATVTVERDIKNIMNLKVNGRKESSSRYMRTQVLLSHLPLLMAQDPKNVLIIGLGSGVTVGSASLHPVQEIKAVELESTILEASRFFGDVNYQPWNDPRVELIVDDGRNYLLANGSSFDVIISQPSIPWITGASNLFTQEFFQLVAKRLKEGGVFSQWFSSTDALGVDHYLSAFKAFTRVFPFVMVFETTPGDLLWIGSKNPLNINYDKVLAKISKLEIAKDLQRIDIDGISDLLSLYLGGDESISTLIDGATINTDDKNYVEFFGPYYYFETKGGGTHVSQVLYPKLPPKVLNTMISLAVNHPMDLNPFLLQLSASSLKQGRLPNALSYVNAALEEKSNGEGHLLKAKVLDRYRIFGGNKESRSLLIKSERGELKRALLDENSSLETLEGIAQGFETLGDIRRAEEIYLDLIRTNPRSAYIQTQLGDFYLRLKNQEKAIQAYQKAIQIDSNQFNPHLQLALLYQNTGDFKEAEAILVKLINKSSSNQKTTALFHLADLQRERGRLEEAARIYQEVLVLDPNHFLAHNNLGNIYQATGNMEGALQAYKVAIQIQPTFFEAYLNLGAVSQRMGRLDQAYQAYQTAIGLNPTDPSGYYNLGFLLKEQGNVEKAVDFFNQFITLAQGNVLFANQLQIARTHLSDLNRLD
jgi:tetratricopeptide (TPR) repeat protein/spermidine synthase